MTPSVNWMLAFLLLLVEPSANTSGFGRAVVRLGDLDGDGRAEFAILEHPQSAVLAVFEQRPAVDDVWIVSTKSFEVFRKHSIPCVSDRDSELPRVVATGDFDGDGVGDVAARGRTSECAIVRVWSGRTGALIVEHRLPGVGSRGAFVALDDLDGDCVPELALGDRGFGEPLLPAGAGRVCIVSGATGNVLHELAGEWRHAALGDEATLVSDGDGHADLFVTLGESGDPQRYDALLLSTATGRIVRTFADLCGRRSERTCTSGGDGRVWVGGSDSVVELRVDGDERCWTLPGVYGEQFGSSLVRLRDEHSPGRTRIAVGSPARGVGEGLVQIFTAEDRRETARVELAPYDDVWNVGHGLAALDDIDGDGVEDLAVATRNDLAGEPGVVFVASGATGTIFWRHVRAHDRVDRLLGAR